MTHSAAHAQAPGWMAILALATVLGSWALACVFPFAAIATIAALTLPRNQGLWLVASVWAANQFVGFFLLSFPWEAQAVGHGIAILFAFVAAFGAARLIAGHIRQPIARIGAAPIAAFAMFQILLRIYATWGGGAENFSAEIIADVARNDALWFTGLMLVRTGLSRATGEPAVLQKA